MEGKSTPVRLLIVEDSEDDADLIVHTLRHGGYDVTSLRVDTDAAMRAALENQIWDLITSDHAMPYFSAPAALKLARSLRPEVPVLIVSGEISQPLAIELLRSGAGDYIRKDNLAQLPHAVERELSEAEARRSRRQTEAALREAIQFHQEIISDVGEGIIVLDRDFRYLVWNRAMEQLSGLPADQVLGRCAFEVFPELRSPNLEAIFARALTGERVTVTERPFTQRGAAPAQASGVIVTYSPHRNAEGQIVGIIGTLRDVTEQWQAEAEVQRLKTFNEEIVQNVAEGIVMQDADGRFTFANPAACALLGRTQAELLEQLGSLVVPPDQQPVLEAANRRRAAGIGDRYELEVTRKDGTRVPILVSGRPRFEAGRYAGSLAVFTDIRERKRVEALAQSRAQELLAQNQAYQARNEELSLQSQALRAAESAVHESEAKYRALVETTVTGYVIIDAAGCVLDANREYVRLSGHDTLAEILGHPVTEWTAPHDQTRNAREVQRCFEIGSVRNLVVDYVDRQGRITPVEINGTVLATAEGRRVVSLCRDIADRRRTEAALLESEARYRSLFEDSPICLWEEDFSEVKNAIDALRTAGVADFRAYFHEHPDEVARCGRLIRPLNVNRAGVELFGARSAAELMGQMFAPNYEAFVDSSTVTVLRDELIARAAGANRFTTEGIQYRLDRTPYYAVLSYAVAPGYEATWAKTFVSIVDLTARKQAEEALKDLTARMQMEIAERQAAEAEVRRLNRDLEARVTERTAQLEAANQELEAFAFSVSHDLRAPLRIISSFSGILEQEHGAQLTAEARQCLDTIIRSTRKMDELIHDLLVFSRLSRQELSRLSVQPARLVQEALDDLRAEQAGRQVEITLGPLPDCQADPALLKQVFVNLLSNALKYTRHRATAQIEVGWCEVGGEGAYFVKDNGAGFDMAHAGRLFGVFQRLHSETEFEGTGVGLAIVQRIIHRHSGRVWAEAEVDRGATFYLTLPGSE